MDPILIGSIGLAGMFLMIALHVPIGIAMGLTGFFGVGFLIGFEPAASLLGTEPSAAIANEGLAVLALFLLMGSFAGAAGLSADLYRLAYAFIGHRPGGLAMATIGGCAGFGAVCGSSVATAATFSRMALPEMLSRGYQPTLASGCIAAGGTLGMIIPPSVVMILYAILTEEDIITLFAASFIPGLLAVVFYFITISIYVRLNPEAGPPGERIPWKERLVILKECWGVVFLATVVSGGIYTGIFTVTEAAAVGASLAILFTIFRGNMTKDIFLQSLGETAANTGMIYIIIMGAAVFSYFVTLSHMPEEVVEGIKSLGLPPLLIILLFELMFLVLGSIFDTVAAMVITLPFVYPVIVDIGYDPVWWGVINVIAMEIGMITPPIGINVFVLHGIAKDIELSQVFRGIIPFFFADVARLLLLTLFPAIVLWLPQLWGLM
jgi:C4-dicarboxylate transporter DctM subunit